MDEDVKRKRTAKDKRQAKKKKIQADRNELKLLRATAAPIRRSTGETKGNGKGKNLKTKDQAGNDLCFSWGSGLGACANVALGGECANKIKRAHKCQICLSPGHQNGNCPQKA